jgi:DNA-binding FadR family transcriptional regulator
MMQNAPAEELKPVRGLGPVLQVKVNDAIQERLVAYLRENRLSAGDRLPSEHLLARSLGVGRNAVREALRSLEALGVVQARVGSGWYVSENSMQAVTEALVLSLELNRDTVAGLNQIRACLELGLFSQAATALTPADIAELEALAHTMIDKAAAGQAYVEEDHQFHRRLYAHLGNPAFSRLMEVIWKAYLELLVLPGSPLPAGKNIEEAAKHLPVVEALRAGDILLAQAKLEASLAKVRQVGAELSHREA